MEAHLQLVFFGDYIYIYTAKFHVVSRVLCLEVALFVSKSSVMQVHLQTYLDILVAQCTPPHTSLEQNNREDFLMYRTTTWYPPKYF